MPNMMAQQVLQLAVSFLVLLTITLLEVIDLFNFFVYFYRKTHLSCMMYELHYDVINRLRNSSIKNSRIFTTIEVGTVSTTK